MNHQKAKTTKPNNKALSNFLLDLTGKEQKIFLLVDVDEKKKDVMVLPEDHVSEATAKVTAKSPPEEFAKGGVTTTPKKPLSLEEGKIEESSSLGVGCVIEGSSYLGVGGGHNLAANIELLTTQNVSM